MLSVMENCLFPIPERQMNVYRDTDHSMYFLHSVIHNHHSIKSLRKNSCAGPATIMLHHHGISHSFRDLSSVHQSGSPPCHVFERVHEDCFVFHLVLNPSHVYEEMETSTY